MSATPMLFCLTGSRRGTTIAPEKETVVIGADPACDVHVPSTDGHPVEPRHAVIRPGTDGYEIEALEGATIFVNNEPAATRRLATDDLIRLGDLGPTIRFRVSEDRRHTKSLGQILVDSQSFSEANSRHGTRTQRYATFARQFVREAVSHGTRWFKLVTAVMFVVIIVLAWALFEESKQHEAKQQQLERALEKLARDDERLRGEIERERSKRQEELRSALTSLNQRHRDFESWRDLFIRRIERVDRDMFDLSRYVGSAKTIYTNCAPGTALVCVGFSYFDVDTGQFIRHEVDEKSGEKITVAGVYSLELGGSGPKYVQWVLGSGFLVDRDGLVITNRHVVDPWWEEAGPPDKFLRMGLRPHREALFACFPTLSEVIDCQRVAVSKEADAAVIRLTRVDETLPLVPLSRGGEAAAGGQKVVLLGYPLGLEGLVTKLDTSVREQLRDAEAEDEGELLRLLASVGAIQPTMTEGVLSNITAENLVYDASTTSGGSGGPIFGADGGVIGINTAITRFSGANLGVPIQFAEKLLLSDGLGERTFSETEISPDGVSEAIRKVAAARKPSPR